MPSLTDRTLRFVLTAGFALLKQHARSRPGVHVVALTSARRIVLVRLRYAKGWRLPGGGQDTSESIEDAGLRELTEEIGMTSHGSVEHWRVGRDSLLIVRNVSYQAPRWSWEVERIAEAPLDSLPDDLAPVTGRWLRAISSRLHAPARTSVVQSPAKVRE